MKFNFPRTSTFGNVKDFCGKTQSIEGIDFDKEF